MADRSVLRLTTPDVLPQVASGVLVLHTVNIFEQVPVCGQS